jgi:uncharacterized protein YbjT (DUF2867 family)
MAAPVLVTGGTGTLGRLVVPRLRAAGCEVRVLSRRRRALGEGIEVVTGDLTTGEGIDAAVAGAGVIAHCAGSRTGDQVKAGHLVRAAATAGARHLVFISVVGADRVPQTGRLDRAMFGYFGSKLAAERVVAGSGLPWTTLRATQFHDSVYLVVSQLARLPVAPVPAGIRFQPVDTGEVADRLVELVLGPPSGLVPDLAGPGSDELAGLLRGYLRTVHRRRPILRVPVPGRAAQALRAGANLAPDRAVGHRTWEEFLEAKLPTPSHRGAGPA